MPIAIFTTGGTIDNLGLAFGAIQLCPVGVYVVANGTVFLGSRVRKNLELNCFEPL